MKKQKQFSVQAWQHVAQVGCAEAGNTHGHIQPAQRHEARGRQGRGKCQEEEQDGQPQPSGRAS